MDRSDKTILVVGATGQQGNAAARHLLEDGWSLRALVRHPDSNEAKRLRDQGVELIQGDLLDRASLDFAVDGVYGVFSMQTPAEVGFKGEELEGLNIADAAAEAGVEHFVFSSVEGAQSDNGPGWVVSKHNIEERIKALGLPATIWRPVTFMENFLSQRDQILAGHLSNQLWPESMMYYIAVDDIGRFVALAFREPERFVGMTMPIAGDMLTMEDAAVTFSETLGITVEFEHTELPYLATPARPEPGEVQPRKADIEECRRLLPDISTLGKWIEATGWKTLVARRASSS